MFWKFFELPKFQQSEVYKTINKDSLLKVQWLEFLIDCSKQKVEPNRDEIIKKGYEIMKVTTWDYDTRVLYWKQKASEQDFLETQEDLKKEEYMKGRLEGKLEGKIDMIKTLFKCGIPEEKIMKESEFLTQGSVKYGLEGSIKYIQDHLDATSSDICNHLGLIGSSSESYDHGFSG